MSAAETNKLRVRTRATNTFGTLLIVKHHLRRRLRDTQPRGHRCDQHVATPYFSAKVALPATLPPIDM